MPGFYYCIPARNEGRKILECLSSLNSQSIRLEPETIVCVNGCSDRTEDVVRKAALKFRKLRIRIVKSEKGKSLAQNAIVKSVKDRRKPLVFVDADTVLDKDCVRILLKELKDNRKLIIVGAWALPSRPLRMSLWQSFLYSVLHVRAFFPEAEVSVNDVSAFKSFAFESPQPLVSPEFESRSKIFIHGRAFALRNAGFFALPEDRDFADDTFLPNFIHSKFGPGVIRTRFDALVYYQPYLSLKKHFFTYWRVFLDKRRLDSLFPESRRMEATRLDWRFITSKGFVTALRFLAYSWVKGFEELAFRLLPRKPISHVWS